MRSRFALLWLRNAAALYAGSFTVIELALGAADTSLRSLTTFWGFVFVLWLHSVACIGVGLLLTHLLGWIERPTPQVRDLPPVTFVFGRPGWPREKGQYLAQLVQCVDIIEGDRGVIAELMKREVRDYHNDDAVAFCRGFVDGVAQAREPAPGVLST